MTLHHVSLGCPPDLLAGEARVWQVLGFVGVEPPEGLADTSLWFQAGETQVHLVPEPATRRESGTGHVAVVCPEFDETVEALAGLGIEVDHRTPYWGSPRAKMTTPAGHLVELMAAPPEGS